jgi:hypothetical protein
VNQKIAANIQVGIKVRKLDEQGFHISIKRTLGNWFINIRTQLSAYIFRVSNTAEHCAEKDKNYTPKWFIAAKLQT